MTNSITCWIRIRSVISFPFLPITVLMLRFIHNSISWVLATADVFDPFAPRSLSQVFNLMDQLMDNPFMGAPRGLGAGTRRGWDVKEDNEALYLRMDMPGLDKENIKITVEQNTLVIRGEGKRESEDEEYGRRYSSRIDLPPNVYKIDEIHAEMKHGVLKIRVPKVKEEERKDVYHVQVE